MPLGLKLCKPSFWGGESESEGQNTQKNQVLVQIWVISEEKIKESVKTVLWLSSCYRKSPNEASAKFCNSKGRIITNITGKFHSGLQCSSCFMETTFGLKLIF